MSLQVQDLGELAYGGLVTGLGQWDKKRVEDGKIEGKELFKKAGTYAYLVPGGISTLATSLGWMRRYDPWTERIAHGFIYGFPGFIMDLVNAFAGGEGVAGVKEAERLLAAARSRGGAKTVGQTSKPGFEDVQIY